MALSVQTNCWGKFFFIKNKCVPQTLSLTMLPNFRHTCTFAVVNHSGEENPSGTQCMFTVVNHSGEENLVNTRLLASGFAGTLILPLFP